MVNWLELNRLQTPDLAVAGTCVVRLWHGDPGWRRGERVAEGVS